MPIVVDSKSGNVTLQGGVVRFFRDLEAFAGHGPGNGWLWTRWASLRLLGACLLVSFIGYWSEGPALLGWHGIAPAGEALIQLSPERLGELGRLMAFPSLLWISSSETAIGLVSLLGGIAATALTLNVLPRISAGICWVTLLSLGASTQFLPSCRADSFLLEATALAIFLAPPGVRPGLAIANGPSTLATLSSRLFVLRVMLEAGPLPVGLSPLNWQDFASVLHWAFAVAIPIAVLLGRRARIILGFTWAGTQVVNCSAGSPPFDCLLYATLATPLFDDRLIARILSRTPPEARAPGRSRTSRIAALLLSIHLFVATFQTPSAVISATRRFLIANDYGSHRPAGPELTWIGIEGSNDGGRTWRAYERKHSIKISPEGASPPSTYRTRLDAILSDPEATLDYSGTLVRLGLGLIEENPGTRALFSHDPFPDAPPDRIAFPVFRLERVQGTWRGRYVRDFSPTVVKGDDGIHPE